jgi:hypothetical protein
MKKKKTQKQSTTKYVKRTFEYEQHRGGGVQCTHTYKKNLKTYL